MNDLVEPSTPTHEPQRSQIGDSLASALVAFQRDLPSIGKSNTATVKSDKGSYSYKYADLAEVSAVVLPALAGYGLSFSSLPTVTDDGKFVLRYTLLHVSGEERTGSYPLPAPTTAPQAMGSAITYARRYCLCAVTGVAPDKDDDDAAAAHQANERAQRNGNGSGQSRDELLRSVKTLSSTLREALAIDEYEWMDRVAKICQNDLGVDVITKLSEEGAVEDIDLSKLQVRELHPLWARLNRKLKEVQKQKDLQDLSGGA